MAGQAIGAGVEGGVAERYAVVDGCACLGVLTDQGFEQAMDGLRAWIVALAGIEAHQQLLAFGGWQYRQIAHR